MNKKLFVPEGREAPFRRGDLLLTQAAQDALSLFEDHPSMEVNGVALDESRTSHKFVGPDQHGLELEGNQVVAGIGYDTRFAALMQINEIVALRDAAAGILGEEMAKSEEERMPENWLNALRTLSETPTHDERDRARSRREMGMPRMHRCPHPHEFELPGDRIPSDERILQGMKDLVTRFEVRTASTERLNEVVRNAMAGYFKRFGITPEMADLNLRLPKYKEEGGHPNEIDALKALIQQMGCELTYEAVRNNAGSIALMVMTCAADTSYRPAGTGAPFVRFRKKGVAEIQELLIDPFVRSMEFASVREEYAGNKIIDTMIEKWAGKYIDRIYRFEFCVRDLPLDPLSDPEWKTIDVDKRINYSDPARRLFARRAVDTICREVGAMINGSVVIDISVECDGEVLDLDGAISLQERMIMPESEIRSNRMPQFKLTKEADNALKSLQKRVDQDDLRFGSNVQITIKGVRLVLDEAAQKRLEAWGIDPSQVVGA